MKESRFFHNVLQTVRLQKNHFFLSALGKKQRERIRCPPVQIVAAMIWIKIINLNNMILTFLGGSICYSNVGMLIAEKYDSTHKKWKRQ